LIDLAMMGFDERLVVLAIGMAIEAVIAYPNPLYAAIGHPVSWLGRLISLLERTWNRPTASPSRRKLMGFVTLGVVLAVVGGLGLALEWAIAASPLGPGLGLLVGSLATFALIAAGSLDQHVRAVAQALETEGIQGGRRAVSMIVGRDPDQLDEAGVSRAAIESLAENTSDGVTAPIFWFLVAGLPGLFLYKAINTLDSMIGHKSDRYRDFGYASARLDDFVNLPASRLTALVFTGAALVMPGASARAALAAVRRDARHHKSPNAGWPEAAMAGALGFKLAGPRVYHGVLVEDAYMGDGRAELAAADIRRALGLYRRAITGALALIVVAAWAI
jgi:adenosylcobinamide-phosphate synthase